MFSMPLARKFAISLAIRSRVELTHVRWARAGTPHSSWTKRAMTAVLAPVVPPAAP